MVEAVGPGSLPRCAAVWLVATGLVMAVAWWLLPDLAAGAATLRGERPTLERLLGQVAAAAAATCALWWWSVTAVTTAMAATGRLRTRVPTCPGAWRWVVLAACGVAVASGLAVPAHAGSIVAADGREQPRRALSGLPLPDRPTVAVHRDPTPSAAPSAAAADVVVVVAGDNLWSIAADRLPAAASPDRIGAAWHRLYAANRAVIGPDPDLILPGQRLRVRAAGDPR